MNGRRGVVNAAGDYIFEPKYWDVRLMPKRFYKHGPVRYNTFVTSLIADAADDNRVLPMDEISSVMVLTGKKRENGNYEYRFLDFETGADLLNRGIYSSDTPTERDVNIDRETGVAVIHYNFIYLNEPYKPAKYKNDKFYQGDSICVYDLKGNEIMPGYCMRLVNDDFILTCVGKKVKQYPVASAMVDGVPCIVEVKGSSMEDLSDELKGYWGESAIKDISLINLSGKQIKTPKYEPRFWAETGTYRPESLPQNLVGQKEKEHPLVAQLAEGREALKERMKNKGMLPEKPQKRHTPTPKEWETVYTSPDSVFSIVKYGAREGIALYGTELTVACKFNEIKPLEGVPGVFTVRDSYGYGLSDGFSLTISPGFKFVNVLDDGTIELRQFNSEKPGPFEYVEYADANGRAIGSNLDQMLANIFGEGSTLKDESYKIMENAKKTGRKFIRPYTYLYEATVRDDAGDFKGAYDRYRSAYLWDTSLGYARQRIEELRPIVEQIREQERAAEEARIRAERAERAQRIAAALQNLSYAIQNLGNTINSVSHKNRPIIQTPVVSNSGKQTTTTTPTASSAPKREKRATPSAADINNRNIDSRTYNDWASRLIKMQCKSYPYQNGYTMDEVREAQSHMRDIRTKWETKGMWPYGVSSMETWNGR